MATVRCACLLLVVAVVAGCTPAAPDPTAATTPATGSGTTVARAGAGTLVVAGWELPSPAVAAQPDLVATADGGLLLSWLTPQEDGHALEFARHADGRWSAPQRIASGDD